MCGLLWAKRGRAWEKGEAGGLWKMGQFISIIGGVKFATSKFIKCEYTSKAFFRSN
jgi:hypothetical protein